MRCLECLIAHHTTKSHQVAPSRPVKTLSTGHNLSLFQLLCYAGLRLQQSLACVCAPYLPPRSRATRVAAAHKHPQQPQRAHNLPLPMGHKRHGDHRQHDAAMLRHLKHALHGEHGNVGGEDGASAPAVLGLSEACHECHQGDYEGGHPSKYEVVGKAAGVGFWGVHIGALPGVAQQEGAAVGLKALRVTLVAVPEGQM
eukprot:TRINITY_DN200_c0_g1_i2.p1 TRINITY_DN200_c0_g1~~TRINITY_DN200_c0_g1_i2.p1  ORF type:complete len:199 (-),score=2.37 TRINITY_DN200_c0_g1_i2:531-1127(-)